MASISGESGADHCNAAEGASPLDESLRQKDADTSHLWRVSPTRAPKEQAHTG